MLSNLYQEYSNGSPMYHGSGGMSGGMVSGGSMSSGGMVSGGSMSSGSMISGGNTIISSGGATGMSNGNTIISSGSSGSSTGMSSDSYTQYHATNGRYYQEPVGSTNVVDNQGNFVGYQDKSGTFHSVTTVPVTRVNKIQTDVTMQNQVYYKAPNNMLYREPMGVQNIVNENGYFIGYKNSLGETVTAADIGGIQMYQYNALSAAEKVNGIIEAQKSHTADYSRVQQQRQQEVNNTQNQQQTVDTTMSYTYYHYNNMYYQVPTNATIMTDSQNRFVGYQTSTGQMVHITNITGLNQDQFSALHIGQYEGQHAATTSIQDSTRMNNVGVQEGQQAAQTSMAETYYHFNNMYYKVPTNAIIMTNSQNQFTGYQTSTGQTFNITNMAGLNQDQFSALHIAQYEGEHAAATSIQDSTRMNNVGVNAGQVGVVAGRVGVAAGQIGVNAGHVGVVAGRVGVAAGQIGVNQAHTTSYYTKMDQAEGANQGQQAAATSMNMTYYHYNGMYYKLPVNALIMRNSQNEFTGYQTSSGQTIGLGSMIGLNQDQFSALHIGKYEGVQAAMTSIHDSTKMNNVGVNAGQVGVVAGRVGVAAGQIGVQEGQQAATTSMDDTYYHWNGMFYKIPENSIIMRNAQNEFTGYQTSSGESVELNNMHGLNREQFTDLHIGQYEGQHAATTSISDSTSMNNVGVQEGQQAAQTSMDDTYLHMGSSYYRIPRGATVQYGNNGELTGYSETTSSGFTVTTLSHMTKLTQEQYSQTQRGQVNIQRATDTSSFSTNLGRQEGEQAEQTSENDTYVHYGGHIYQIPAGSIEQYNSQNEFSGYMLSNGETITAEQMTSMHQGDEGVQEGQQAAQTSVNMTYYHYNNMFYKIPEGVEVEMNTNNEAYYTNTSGEQVMLTSMSGIDQDQFSALHISQYEGEAIQTNTVQTSSTVTSGQQDISHVNYSGRSYNIPAGAQAEYNSQGQLTGYFTQSDSRQGGVAEYNTVNGVSTLTGYHVPRSSMRFEQGSSSTGSISGSGSSTVVSSGSSSGSSGSSGSSSGHFSTGGAGCNNVSPVANGTAQYNHHGCITGYIVKNTNLMMLI